MIDYQLLKTLHVSCVGLSLAGFTLRSGLMLAGSSLLHNRWTRTLPHLVDSLLFFSGLGLAALLHQYPGTASWLTAKAVALVLYVILGAVALRGRTLTRRVPALVSAYLAFGYMVGVAVHKSPLSWWY